MLKDSCDVNGDYCQFHRRFLSLLNNLPSKAGYNQFSIFKGGVASQNVKADWIKGALSDIISKMDVFSADFTSKSITDKFLDDFEIYNFEEFFSNETSTEGGADPPTVDGDVVNFDLQGTLTRYERWVDLLTRYVELQSAKTGSANSGDEDCEYLTPWAEQSYFFGFLDGAEISLGMAFFINHPAKMAFSKLISKL